ncbi:MAG TPA: 50S ribosomal protein L11 methyltransferase [Verrucomicrobiae bacterium]|nr:50S ribosomal protein L11 methyltransferase [Verrucomicrobiae bacterium]
MARRLCGRATVKSRKQLWRISVATSLEAEDAVMELLNSFSPNPASAYFNLETETSLVSVFSEKPFSKQIHAQVAIGLKRIENCGLKISAGKIKIEKVKREDWAESWKKHFKPIEIGDALLVKPSWSKKRPHKNQAAVVLDPGLSFGTGQHPTTSFCLSEIVQFKTKTAREDARSTKTKSFLDIGTGSGILAIAAAKLDYRPIRVIDFDPEAIRVAKANAKTNGVLNRIHISRGDVTKFPLKSKHQFDLVCANLISNLLIAERKKIVAQMKPEGVLVLAGILKSEFCKVQEAFEDFGLQLFRCKIEKEWQSGAFCLA